MKPRKKLRPRPIITDPDLEERARKLAEHMVRGSMFGNAERNAEVNSDLKAAGSRDAVPLLDDAGIMREVARTWAAIAEMLREGDPVLVEYEAKHLRPV